MSQYQHPHGAQPPPPINPGQPTPPVPPVATNPAAKKNRKMVILSALAGLLALCCLGGLVAAITANDDQPTPPEGLTTQPQQQPPAEGPVPDRPPSEESEDEAGEPELPAGTITDQGTLIVGTDIEPGTYRGIGCGYWERVSDASGDFDSILANGNIGTGENLTVTIQASDFAFDNSCAFLFPIDALRTVEDSATTNEEYGILIVGKDIHPGTWSGTATGHCYWARLSGFTGDFDAILANDNVDAGEKFTVTVRPTDEGLELDSECGPLTKS